MVYSLLLILFVIDAVLLMIVILLQDSKGQGLGGAFGAGGQLGTAMFGGRGAGDFLSKATTYLGTAFLGLAVLMTIVGPTVREGTRSAVLDAAGQEEVIPTTGLPLLPGAAPAAAPEGGLGQPATAHPDTSGSGL